MASSIEYETFKTKREAVTWMKDCQRRSPDKSYTVIPMSEVPEDHCRRGRAKGHRWAMRWVWVGDRLRIDKLRI